MATICKGITAKNKNCKKKTAHDSGFCPVHRDQENKEDEKHEEKKDIKKDEKKKELKKKEVKKKEVKKEDIGWNQLYKKFNVQKAPIIRQQKDITKQYNKVRGNLDLIGMVIEDTEHLMNDNPLEKGNLQIALFSFRSTLHRLSQEELKFYNQLITIQQSLIGINKFIKYYNNRYKIKKCNKDIKETECVICLNEFKKPDNCIQLYCSHTFHVDCIYDWFQNKDTLTCPTCRDELK